MGATGEKSITRFLCGLTAELSGAPRRRIVLALHRSRLRPSELSGRYSPSSRDPLIL